MAKRTLDEHVRDHYEQQQLSQASLHSLKTLIRSGSRAAFAAEARPRWQRWAAAAAVVMAMLAGGIWLGARRNAAPEHPAEIARMVAEQAAVGHNEHQELEFRVTRCEELRRHMKSLDFTPIEPEMMHMMNMRIVCARYTTIKGGMAAQIVYVDAKGVPCTLYEVRPTDKLARMPAGEHDIDRVRVNIWREKGLVMVLARPIA